MEPQLLLAIDSCNNSIKVSEVLLRRGPEQIISKIYLSAECLYFLLIDSSGSRCVKSGKSTQFEFRNPRMSLNVIRYLDFETVNVFHQVELFLSTIIVMKISLSEDNNSENLTLDRTEVGRDKN